MLAEVCQANEAWTWMGAWVTDDRGNGCVRTGLPEPRTPHKREQMLREEYVSVCGKSRQGAPQEAQFKAPFSLCLQEAGYSLTKASEESPADTEDRSSFSRVTHPPASSPSLTKGGPELVILLWD